MHIVSVNVLSFHSRILTTDFRRVETQCDVTFNSISVDRLTLIGVKVLNEDVWSRLDVPKYDLSVIFNFVESI